MAMSIHWQDVLREIGREKNTDGRRQMADRFALELTEHDLPEIEKILLSHDCDTTLGALAVFSSEHLVGLPIIDGEPFYRIVRQLNPFQTHRLLCPIKIQIAVFSYYLLQLYQVSRAPTEIYDQVRRKTADENIFRPLSEEEIADYYTMINHEIRELRGIIVGKPSKYLEAIDLIDISRNPSVDRIHLT